jgi:molecular chaperone GrpE
MNDEENLKNQDTEGFDDFEITPSDEEGSALTTKDVTKKLREEIKKLRTERDEYLVGWQRAKADYVNLQKEADERQKRTRELLIEDVMNDFLPVLDSFDMAMANQEAWQKVEPTWRMGVEYIYQQLSRTIAEYGVTKIGVVGEMFDPQLHEAVENIPADTANQDHTVAAVIQSGYKMGDRTIRPARVKVYIK